MKKLLLLLFGVILSLPVRVFSETNFSFEYEGQTLQYTITNENAKTVETSGTKLMSGIHHINGALIIPSKVKYNGVEYTVTGIGMHSFYQCEGITSVVLPSTITSMGSGAFGIGTGIIKAVFPNTVSVPVSRDGGTATYDPNNVLFENGFVYDAKKTTIIYAPMSLQGAFAVPSTVTTIGPNAFLGCTKLSSVSLPSRLTTINDGAFKGCSSLSSAKLPETLTSIGASAFEDCTALTDITIPNSVTTLGNKVFQNCIGASSLKLSNKLTSIPLRAFAYCEKIPSADIPGTASSIGTFAFYECSSLTSVKIPSSVKEIGNYAFQETGLTSVEIPNSVTKIGNSVFCLCHNLTTATIGNSVETIGYNLFYKCEKLTSIVFPNSITSFDINILYGCTSLKSVVLPNQITTITKNFFNGCTGLTSVEIPASVTSIEVDAFSGCTGLTSVIVPPHVTSIADGAFNNCTGLIKSAYPATIENPFANGMTLAYNPEGTIIDDSIIYGPGKTAIYFVSPNTASEFTIPASVTAITDNAFTACDNLTSVISPMAIPPVMDNDAFSGLYDTAILTVPEASLTDYLDTNWSQFKNIRFGNPAVVSTVYSDGVLNYRLIPATRSGENNLALVIPGDYSNLNEVTIPERFNRAISDGSVERYYITGIAPKAFSDCTGLKSVSFHRRNSSTTIGAYAFAGSGVTSVSLSSSIESIGENAFQNTSELEEITMPAALKTVGADAFKGSKCSRVNVSDIKAWCNIDFANADANPLSYGELYKDGEKLTTLVIPNLTTEIKKYAFNNASAITSVILGNGMKSIGEGAFNGCSGLAEVVFPPSMEAIGASAFAGNSSLATIVMGHSVKTIGDKAFNGCAASNVSITAQTPPAASNNTFSRYTGKFYVQGDETADVYYDAINCWGNFDPEVLTDPTGIDINTRFIFGQPGDTFQLIATLQPGNVSLPHIFWSSTNPEIATVDENGLVTIVSDIPTATVLSARAVPDAPVKIVAESVYAAGPVAEVGVYDVATGIGDVTAEELSEIDYTAPFEVYNLQGMMKADNIDNLPAGVYIVRQGSIVKKILVK
jgi:hypothetical protein